MGDRYSATGLQTAVEVSPGETILNVFSPGTTNRAWVYYFAISTRAGAMADQVQTAQLQRTTVVGTEGAGVVPAPTDFDAPPAISDAAEDHSAEPTFTSATEMFEQDIHVRNTVQVQLQPDGHLSIPAVTAGGMTMRSFSTNYAGGAACTMHFRE